MPFKGYRMTSPFGLRQDPFNVSKTQFHTGVDLVKSHNAPIFAFMDGVVIFAGMGQTGSGFGGYGNVVALRDKNNCLHVYAHLNSVAVRKGQSVRKGQEVGKQGNTGHSTGSHLHYEIRKNSQSSPPYGWIADRANNCYEPSAYLKRHATDESATSISGIKVAGHIVIGGTKTGKAYVVDRPSSTNSKDLAIVNDGTVIPIAGSITGWWEVIWNGKRAYVNAKFGKLK